VDSLIKMLH